MALLRRCTAASGEAMNLMNARAASGCFDTIRTPTAKYRYS